MNSTILVLGGEDDDHAMAVLSRLQQAGHDAELLDSRWFPTALGLWHHPTVVEGGLVLPSGRELPFAQIGAVYWRSYNGVAVPPLENEMESYVAHNDARCLFESILIQLPTRWVNGWAAYQLHQTKPVQLAMIKKLGVTVPETIWTNDPTRLRAFAQRHPQAIFKPVQGGDETRRLTAEHLTDDNLANLRLAPITIQEEIVGTNIRVFVIGSRVFACEVRTPQLDYRQDLQADLLVHQLPQQIEEQSRLIASALQLVWTGIDYRLTRDGEYVFLEANPSPMFLGFEEQTGLPLAANLIRLLVSGD